MEEIVINYSEKPTLDKPIVIEGLPGVGNIGKLAAEHLIDEIDAVRFAEIYSKHFPPQVLVNEDGIVRLVNNEIYYKKKEKEGQDDLVIIVGDYQGLTPEGQYELADRMLKIANEYGSRRIYTLGGYSVGKLVDKPKVFGAATNAALVEEMKSYGTTFSKTDPSGGIIGASGLFLGMGKFYGIEAACLMGETSGYFVDPKSAEAVLRVLTKALKISIDFSELEVKAKQIDQITNKIRELEEAPPQRPKREDLGYIG
jgi:uncharacterized protein (TIGR00162 family)